MPYDRRAMSESVAAETALLSHLLNLFAVPAYVTDRLNRIQRVNGAFARLMGDPHGDGLRGDELFVHSLILGRYRDHFPRRHLEIASCVPSLIAEIESGSLAPEVGRLLGGALRQDEAVARLARDAVEGNGPTGWDGTVHFRRDDGSIQELAETVVPLAGAEDGGSTLFLNLWSKPGRRAPAPERAGMLLALTPREREVARLYATGLSAPDIAATLGISIHTARDYRDSIYSKLGIHSRAELGRLMQP
jgi:DNA-binding CsgD family transcriptional regulator